jgi:hypothetical protein
MHISLRRYGFLISLIGLTGCSATQYPEAFCARLLAHPITDDSKHHYTTMVVTIDGQPVAMVPEYDLLPGQHALRLVELIDAPTLAIPVQARSYQDLQVTLEPNTAYYLAAKHLHDFDADYWKPVIMKKEPISCVMDEPKIVQTPQGARLMLRL